MRVEKISYQINWKAFRKGTSFFIPCLKPREAKKEIREITRRLKYQTVMKVVIEESIKGVRVWRI
jgi:hypothetical protein